jgi:hypothetical protein
MEVFQDYRKVKIKRNDMVVFKSVTTKNLYK